MENSVPSKDIPDVSSFWEAFGDSSEFEEIESEFSGSLANDVLNLYGISSSSSKGGSLNDLDIKQMDALTVIKLSLLQESAKDGELYEMFMNSEGEVDFKTVGGYSGRITDIYHTIQTMTYIEECTGVMITGKKPLTYRKDTEWSTIWGKDAEIFDTDQMNNSACVSDVFNQWVTIVFNDPHLESSYKDGIDNLYEINESNPYDNIIGYAYYCCPDKGLIEKNTTITLVKECSIPILLHEEKNNPSVGKLQKLTITNKELIESGCWDDTKGGEEGATNDDIGVELKIPEKFRYETIREVEVDKFKGVSKVYIIGQEIDQYEVLAVDEASSIAEKPETDICKVYASINNVDMKSFLLEEGKHYVVKYPNKDNNESTVDNVTVVFSDRSSYGNPKEFGDETEFYINPLCEYAKVKTLDENDSAEIGCFLPTSKDSGILVNQIWVGVDLETWAVQIHDSAGKALEIAKTLKYGILPLVEVSEPAPIAFNGSLLDLTDSIKDHDPTTAQDFDNTEFEEALEEMEGGGLSLSLSFLEGDNIATLSDVLYDYMNSGDGQETTYVCGPNCEPELGGKGPNGGIINNITYSYNDSSSYIISINEGQKIQGDFAQTSGAAVSKMSEEVSSKGTIIQDLGNNVHYKVRIDGIGERVAFNSCPEILRVGDKVSCSLHNVPVES